MVENPRGSWLDRALHAFSGYLALDELYEKRRRCVLSAVDAISGRRLIYDVLPDTPGHPVGHAQVRPMLQRLNGALQTRGLRVRGVVSDGSMLYRQLVGEVFGPSVPHQVCRFHVMQAIHLAALHAVARLRQRLKAAFPHVTRGRPCKTPHDQERVRQLQAGRQRVRELFENRYLLVRRTLSAAQRRRLLRITRGLPQLRRLRGIVTRARRLFDRRRRRRSALARLRRLQRDAARLSIGTTLAAVLGRNLARALTFLDDRRMPATSNAVERSNRRYRKVQNSVYRVRTIAHIRGRLAMDLLRETYAPAWQQTLSLLSDGNTAGALQ